MGHRTSSIFLLQYRVLYKQHFLLYSTHRPYGNQDFSVFVPYYNYCMQLVYLEVQIKVIINIIESSYFSPSCHDRALSSAPFLRELL